MGGYRLHFPGRQIAAVFVGSMAVIGSATAQQVSSADVQRQVDDAFREVLAKVDSKDARLKYASLLVQAGNFEGGIAALEGLLLAPNAPASLRVELAVLYFRLGSYALAEAYLRDAIADSRLDSALKKQAETMLLDVVKRNKISSLTGTLMAGLRGQSNPTAATKASQILSKGVLLPRDERARPKSDIDGQLWGKLDHVYDLGAQNEASVVTSLVGLIDHYASVDSYAYRPESTKPYDVATIAGTSGVRFKPFPAEVQNLTLRPHLIFGDTLLNGHQYFSAGGLGLDGSYRVSDRLTWSGVYAVKRFSYVSRPDITDSTLLGGVEHSTRVRSVVEVGVNKVLMGEVGFVDRSAKRSDFEFSGPEAKLAYIFTYADPVANTGHNWTTTIVGSALQRRYRGVDPAVDPNIRRRDTERRMTLQNVMPFSRDMSLQVQLDYTDAPSSLPNYDYSNVAGSVNVLWNF